MSATCPNCQAQVPDGFKFCGACGTPLAAVAAPAPVPAPTAPPAEARRSEERKIVTILFADVQGFTALSEKMDPEEVRDTMQTLFHRVTDAITHYGGTVDKYIGDCVMALFGVPVAHEDDPERAIRAALKMHEEVRRFREERGLAIGMRIGINTGMVLAGYIGDRAADYTVMGDEVNLASRLEHAAPVDGIIISHKTWLHVADLFECDTLEPIQVKGKAEPVRVYLVKGERKQSGEAALRGRRTESRMVGRDVELQKMVSLTRQALVERQRQFLLLTAPPGVGKSRLLYEFHRTFQEQPDPPQAFKGRALQFATNIPFYLFGNLLKDKCGILDEDSAAEARAKLLSGVRSVMEGSPEAEIEEITHLMAFLIAIDFPGSPHVGPLKSDPIQLNQRARQAFLDFFRRATEQPTLIYLEDIHWAEQSSIDMILEIFQYLRGRPLVMVALARPEFFERFPDFTAGLAPLERIDLGHLSPESVRELTGDLLRRVPAIPETLHARVIEKTEGNPYYVEEMVKMFLESGVVELPPDEGPGRVVEERLNAVEIPDTIQGLLQARLDKLSLDEKGVLQRAAVVGRTFWQGAIDMLLDDLTVAKSEQVLRALAQKGFIFDRQQSSFMGNEYIFKHALLRDVTYETILKKKRIQYHASFAGWIETHGGDRRDEFMPLIAMHYELGGVKNKAQESYYLAGEKARMSYANVEALSYYEKTITLAEKPSFSHLRRRGSIREVLGDYQGAREDYEAMLAACRDKTDEGVANKHMTEIHIRLGDYGIAREFAEQSMALGEEKNDQRMIAETLNLIGRIFDYTGETDSALDFYTRSMEAHRTLKNPLGEATGLGNIGIIHFYRGEYDKAVAAYKAALEIDRAEKNKRRMTMMMSNLGEAYQLLGALDEAVAYHKEALTLARAIGFRMMQVEILRNLGIEHVYQGKYEEGVPQLEEAMRMVEEIGDMELLPQVLFSLGEGLVRAGRKDDALAPCNRLLAIALERNMKDSIAKGMLLKSWCLSAKRCRAELKRGLQIAQELQSHSLLWEFHGALAEAETEPAVVRKHLEDAKSQIDFTASTIEDEELRAKFLALPSVGGILDRHAALESGVVS